MIQWLLDAAVGEERETVKLISKIQFTNFAAIHSSSTVAHYLAVLLIKGFHCCVV